MSQILRALSRGRRPVGGGAPERDVDAVMAGLGVRQGAPSGRPARRLLFWVPGGLVLLAGAGIVAANLLRDKPPAASTSLPALSDPRTSSVPGGDPELSGPALVPAPAADDADEAPAHVPAPPNAPAAPHASASLVQTAIETTDSAPAPRPERRPRDPAAVTLPPVATPPPAPAPDVDHFKLALYYHRAGDFENALTHYRVLLKRDELNAEVHNNLGLLFKDKRLYDEAIKEFQRALYIDPKYVVARNNLSVTLLEAGRPDAAATELRIIVAAEPENADALVNLALALSAMKQGGGAQETLMRALGIEPRHAAAHYNLARLYDQELELGKALEHYRAFLEYAGAEHAAIVPDVNRRVAALQKKQDG